MREFQIIFVYLSFTEKNMIESKGNFQRKEAVTTVAEPLISFSKEY